MALGVRGILLHRDASAESRLALRARHRKEAGGVVWPLGEE
jgi:hypothetical protein